MSAPRDFIGDFAPDSRFGRRSVPLALLLGGIACAGIGCSAPKDNDVITQADQVNTTLAPAEIQDPRVNDYMTAIGRRIEVAAKDLDAQHVGPKSHFTEETTWMFGPEIGFHLVNSKTLNAFTTGGHHVYVYNQLLQTCTKEEDLAAVMSHEFAHIYCRHVAAGISRQQKLQGFAAGVGFLGAFAGGGSAPAAGAAGGQSSFAGLALAAGQFIGMGYTRGDESLADQYGFKFYTQAGWDPSHFADFFQTMINLGYDTTPEELSDHPKLSNRVTAAKQRVAGLPPGTSSLAQPVIDTPDQFAQVKAAALDDASRTPNDTQLQTAQKLLNAFPSCVAPAEDQTQQSAQAEVLKATGTQKLTPDQRKQVESDTNQ